MGAVNSGEHAPGYTSLVEETARSELLTGTTNANVITLDFLFGPSQAVSSIGEAAVFLQADLVTTALTAALVGGTNYTSLSVSPMPLAIDAGAQLIVGYGGTEGTQPVTLTGGVLEGMTTSR